MPQNGRKNNPPSVPSEYNPEEYSPNQKINSSGNAVVLDESGKSEGLLPNEESASMGGGRRRHRRSTRKHAPRRRSTRKHPLRRRKTQRRH